MTELDFINQIATNPGDMPLRLVFADWLEEQGDSYHLLIRKQLAIYEALKKHPDDSPEVNDLRTDYYDGYAKHRKSWELRFIKPTSLSDSHITFECGLPIEYFLANPSHLVDLTDLALAVPEVNIVIDRWVDGLQQIARYEHLGKVSSLTLLWSERTMTSARAHELTDHGKLPKERFPKQLVCELSQRAARYLSGYGLKVVNIERGR